MPSWEFRDDAEEQSHGVKRHKELVERTRLGEGLHLTFFSFTTNWRSPQLWREEHRLVINVYSLDGLK